MAKGATTPERVTLSFLKWETTAISEIPRLKHIIGFVGGWPGTCFLVDKSHHTGISHYCAAHL